MTDVLTDVVVPAQCGAAHNGYAIRSVQARPMPAFLLRTSQIRRVKNNLNGYEVLYE